MINWEGSTTSSHDLIKVLSQHSLGVTEKTAQTSVRLMVANIKPNNYRKLKVTKKKSLLLPVHKPSFNPHLTNLELSSRALYAVPGPMSSRN
jgi:hypothetical protein